MGLPSYSCVLQAPKLLAEFLTSEARVKVEEGSLESSGGPATPRGHLHMSATHPAICPQHRPLTYHLGGSALPPGWEAKSRQD